MTIHSNHYLERPAALRRFGADDILWVVGAGLVFLGVSPLVLIYLLLIN